VWKRRQCVTTDTHASKKMGFRQLPETLRSAARSRIARRDKELPRSAPVTQSSRLQKLDTMHEHAEQKNFLCKKEQLQLNQFSTKQSPHKLRALSSAYWLPHERKGIDARCRRAIVPADVAELDRYSIGRGNTEAANSDIRPRTAGRGLQNAQKHITTADS
jgi:hypothetical protein